MQSKHGKLFRRIKISEKKGNFQILIRHRIVLVKKNFTKSLRKVFEKVFVKGKTGFLIMNYRLKFIFILR